MRNSVSASYPDETVKTFSSTIFPDQPKPALTVFDPDSGPYSHQSRRDGIRHSPVERHSRPFPLPPPHDYIGVHLFLDSNKIRNIFRKMLEIGIHRQHKIGRCVETDIIKSGLQGSAFPFIHGMTQNSCTACPGSNGRGIRRSVVHDKNAGVRNTRGVLSGSIPEAFALHDRLESLR